jgi:hypothetical protein
MYIPTRAYIAVAVALMVNAVLFGFGAIAVLSIPALNEQASFWLPAVIVTSFVLTPPIAWKIAPRLRARFWNPRHARAAKVRAAS